MSIADRLRSRRSARISGTGAPDRPPGPGRTWPAPLTAAVVAGCAAVTVAAGALVLSPAFDVTAPGFAPIGVPGPEPATFSFPGASLDDKDWIRYDGQPGGNPASRWAPDLATAENGVMRLSSELRDGTWFAGGVMNPSGARVYGRWDVRMRAARSDAFSYHVLLWPEDRQWPPEIDIAESVDPLRRDVSGFFHWTDPAGEMQSEMVEGHGTFDDWHTVSVDWRPEAIIWSVDDHEIGRYTDRSAIPAKPMLLTIQVEGGACERRIAWKMPPCSGQYPTPPERTTQVEVQSVHIRP